MKSITIEGVKHNRPIQKACSQIMLGSAQFDPVNMGQASEILDAYLEAGANVIDTAHQYEGSEEVIGNWIQARGNRDQLYILTKGAHPNDGEPGHRLKPNSIKKDLYESLERLQTDYVDFYALHRDDPSVEVGVIVEALNKHIADGRIHSIGVSNWTNERIEQANEYAENNQLVGFSFNSPNLSLAKCKEPRWEGCISLDQAGITWHEQTQLPLFSWSSQAGGFFSGRFTSDDRTDEEMVRVYYSEENWKRYQRAEQLAAEKQKSIIQIALAYVVNQSFPTAAIIGPQTKQELLSSIEGATITLTESEIKWLDLLVDHY